MPELVRSIVTRLRQMVGNRRHAQRYSARLEVVLMLSSSARDSRTSGGGGHSALKITGYTRDMSETGMAVIVSSIRVGGMYLTGEDRPLRIMLSVPEGPAIEIQGASVRYTQLDDEGEDTGYLIGIHIKDMSDTDRIRYKAYLRTLAKEG